MADTLPLEVSEVGAFASDRARVLPQWAAALPLWAGGRWLWLRVGPAHTLRYWQGSTRNHLGMGETAGLDQVPRAILPCDRNRLSCRACRVVTLVADPGGRAGAGRRALRLRSPPASAIRPDRAVAPDLDPASWHLIELGQDADWHLRPATMVSQQLIDTELQPPLSLGAWLAQLRRRWLPSGQRVSCLPVWRHEEHA